MIHKYRVWSKKFKKYYPVSKLSFEENGVCAVGVMTYDIVYFHISECDLEMWSTITDRNEKEIYEGDRVEVYVEELLSSGDYEGVIEWSNGEWFVDFPKYGCCISLSSINQESIEVVGNIHETKQKKDSDGRI